MADYIKWLRDRVGPSPIQLNFAAAAIVDDGNNVLLQRRSDDGAWGLPGGAIELHESAEEAVIREVAEETGLHIAVVNLIGVYTKYEHTYPNGDTVQPITVFFRCTPTAGRLNNRHSETIDLGYHHLDRLPPLTNRQHQDAITDLKTERPATTGNARHPTTQSRRTKHAAVLTAKPSR